MPGLTNGLLKEDIARIRGRVKREKFRKQSEWLLFKATASLTTLDTAPFTSSNYISDYS